MRLLQQYIWIPLFIILFPFPAIGHAGEFPAPPLTLAKTYKTGIELKDYWISEKLDGVRAYWDGQRLISRQGNRYVAPDWFTADFPRHPLDGELWLGRGQFEALLSVVRKQTPVDQEWRRVQYRVFDLPKAGGDFSYRLQQLQKVVKKFDIPHLHAVHQFRLPDHAALMRTLNETVAQGGEGLMLHRADALYHTGRNNDLLKVKLYQDAEATVLAHLPGQGKYTGMLGALLVKNQQGHTFRIGTGFSDQERRQPAPIGSRITYKYHGKTRKGLPRFASFLRLRP